MTTETLASLPAPSTLVLAAPLPLTLHPAEVYLAFLGVGSRRTLTEARRLGLMGTSDLKTEVNISSGFCTD